MYKGLATIPVDKKFVMPLFKTLDPTNTLRSKHLCSWICWSLSKLDCLLSYPFAVENSLCGQIYAIGINIICGISQIAVRGQTQKVVEYSVCLRTSLTCTNVLVFIMVSVSLYSMQVDRIIFCVFEGFDLEIYQHKLSYYFPPKEEEHASKR